MDTMKISVQVIASVGRMQLAKLLKRGKVMPLWLQRAVKYWVLQEVVSRFRGLN